MSYSFDLRESTLRRLQLLSRYSLAPESLSKDESQFDTLYSHCCDQLCEAIAVLLNSMVVNSDGTSILSNYRISVLVMKDDWRFGAEISGDRLEQMEIDITLTLGFIFSIDVLIAAWMFSDCISPNEHDFRDSEFRHANAAYMENLIPSAILKSFLPEANAAFRSIEDNPAFLSRWVSIASMAVCWGVLHEIGHLVGGHVAFYLSSSGATRFSDVGAACGSSFSLAVSEMVPGDSDELRRGAELFSDIYATVRLADIQAKELAVCDIHDFLSAALMPVSIILMQDTAFTERSDVTLSDQETGAIQSGLYPRPQTRLFNVYATITSLMFPHWDPIGDGYYQRHLSEELRRLCGINTNEEVNFNLFLGTAGPGLGLISSTVASICQHYVRYAAFCERDASFYGESSMSEIAGFAASLIASRHCLCVPALGTSRQYDAGGRAEWSLTMMNIAVRGYDCFATVMHPLNFLSNSDRLNDDAMDFINNWCYGITWFALLVNQASLTEEEFDELARLQAAIVEYLKKCSLVAINTLELRYGIVIPDGVFLYHP